MEPLARNLLTDESGASPAALPSNVPGHTRFAAFRGRLEEFAPPAGWPTWLFELGLFVLKQGWACLFGALMELFKTAAGSWVYPEPSLLRIGGVPLFSGFMYASVGSYLARVFRIFAIRFEPYPRSPWPELLAVLVYANFFAHHWLPDFRIALFLAMGALFWRTQARFTVLHRERSMPLLLGWLLVSLFIWLAENLSTFARAWVYPAQENGWTIVSPAKLGAWYLLMYISFVLVKGRSRNGCAP